MTLLWVTPVDASVGRLRGIRRAIGLPGFGIGGHAGVAARALIVNLVRNLVAEGRYVELLYE